MVLESYKSDFTEEEIAFISEVASKQGKIFFTTF